MPSSSFRRIAALVLIVAAFAVWVGMAPDSGKYDAQVTKALSNASSNEDTADSAPQQQVVNGWVARDLLAIIARQQSDADHREAALLALLIVAVGVGVLAAEAGRSRVVAPSVPPPAGPGGHPAWGTPSTPESAESPGSHP